LGNAFCFKEDKQAAFIIVIEVLDFHQTAQFSKNKDLPAGIFFFFLEMQSSTIFLN